MKILLIEPVCIFQRWPFEIYGTKSYFQVDALSLLQLAAFAPKETRIIDGMNEYHWTPKKLATLLQEYNTRDSIIGIASHSQVSALNTLYNLKLAKIFAPQATIILGGYHATFFDQLWVKLGADLVIRHEAEITYQKILEKFKKMSLTLDFEDNDLIGTTYAKDWYDRINILKEKSSNQQLKLEEIQPKNWRFIFKIPLLDSKRQLIQKPDREFIQNLDILPFPKRLKLDFHLNDIPVEFHGYTTCIETARGCPYQCEFCSTRVMWKGFQRYKSADKVIAEIKECLKYNIHKFLFVDESWGIFKKRDMEILQRIKKEQIDIRWMIQVRADTVYKNPDLMKLAGECGCRVALVGFESIDNETLLASNKRTDARYYYKVRKILNDAGIFIFGFFLIGLPNETDESRKKTLQTMYALADMPFLQQYMKYFNQAYNSERLKNPFFVTDMQHLDKIIGQKDETQRIKRLTNDIRINHFRFLLNPKNVIDMIFASTEVERSRRHFLRFMYTNLIKHALRFNANNFLFMIRGFYQNK
jgi:radical SAM superfamily enzyme YgiQ (UPF0313 family)